MFPKEISQAASHPANSSFQQPPSSAEHLGDCAINIQPSSAINYCSIEFSPY
jgi:hypothetical protein